MVRSCTKNGRRICKNEKWNTRKTIKLTISKLEIVILKSLEQQVTEYKSQSLLEEEEKEEEIENIFRIAEWILN